MKGPILLVEDDENDIFFMTDAFKKAGINQVKFARNGKEALAYLRNASDGPDRAAFPMPDLVMLDMKLPYIMGLDVLKCIRQDMSLSVVVVILSASREAADVSAAYRLGANAYLVKPSDTQKLAEMVKCVKDFWLGLNVLPGGR